MCYGNSCTATNYLGISLNQIPPENMRLYIIDTISLKSPTVITCSLKHDNVISYLVDSPIESIPKNIEKFLKETPSYYYGNTDLFFVIPISMYDTMPKFPTLASYGYGCWHYDTNSKIKRKNYYIKKFDRPVSFLLVAVNLAYFNKCEAGIDMTTYIHSFSPGKRYIIVAYPIGNCEEYD